MDVKVDRSDVIWSYLGVLVSFTTSVITMPIVIYFLDSEAIGLWYVFASIGGITILFDFGFTVTFARNITYCWSGASKLKKVGVAEILSKEPDFRMMKDILTTCKRIYLIISLSAFLLLLTVGTYYIISISHTITGYSHIVAWIIYAFGAFLNLYYNYYDSFLRGVGAVKQANQNRVYARFIQLFAMLLLLFWGYGILGLSLAYLLFGIVFRFLGKHYFYSYNNIGENLNNIKGPTRKSTINTLFKTIWYNAWRDGLVSLSVYLSGQATVILCSLYLTLTETGVYSIGVQIANVVGSLAATLYVTYQPSLQSYWVKGNISEVRKIMAVILEVFFASYIVGVLGVLFVGLPILRLVKPEVVMSISLMIGLFVGQFIMRFRDCFSSYFSCTNRLDYMPAFVISSVLCILLSILLLQCDLKIWGLVIAQIVSQALFNMWFWPMKAYRELRIVGNK